MRKIINPCMCEVGTGGSPTARGYVKIEFKDGRLSLIGVIGPLANGDCRGSAGQCVEAIRQGTPTDDWTYEMLKKLCDIWDRWHLNDMRPHCEHQRELGWDKLSLKEVTIYHYRLSKEAQKYQNDAEKAAIQALKNGETFTPSKEQVYFANLPYSLTKWEGLSEEEVKYYNPKEKLYSMDDGPEEKKTLGLLKPKDHPEGLLTKECPVCGYKYGTKWLHEDVPQEVIDWLFALPNATTNPAWV